MCAGSTSCLPQGMDAWVARLWSRMDRDRNGFVTKKELDCEDVWIDSRVTLHARYDRQSQMSFPRSLAYTL